MKLHELTLYLTVAALLCWGGISAVTQSTLKAEAEMATFDHIFIDQQTEFEKFNFAVKEIKVDGNTVWTKKGGLVDDVPSL